MTPLQQKIAHRVLPPSVRYWRRTFCNIEFWEDWNLLAQEVEMRIPEVMEALECGFREAQDVVWTAYCQAAGGEEDNPFQDAYTEFLQGLPPTTLPLFICHTGIGLDMSEGHSETEAIDMFREWLMDEPENPIFGEYRISKDFIVHLIEDSED